MFTRLIIIIIMMEIEVVFSNQNDNIQSILLSVSAKYTVKGNYFLFNSLIVCFTYKIKKYIDDVNNAQISISKSTIIFIRLCL